MSKFKKAFLIAYYSLAFSLYPSYINNKDTEYKILPFMFKDYSSMVERIESYSLRKDPERKKYYNFLISLGVDRETASLVFSDKFKVYPFAFPKKSDTKTKRSFTYKDYERALRIEEKKVIAREFLKKNRELLERIEKDFGIKKEHLASLIAVETGAGRFLGKFELFNALFSNLLRHNKNPKWRRFYLNEIKHLSYLRSQGYDMFSPSSKAGAIGLTQFMPSSIKIFGVDYDKDGKIDLFSLEDALASAANYLKQHGGDKDITKAYIHYNGHEWFAIALNKINKDLIP